MIFRYKDHDSFLIKIDFTKDQRDFLKDIRGLFDHISDFSTSRSDALFHIRLTFDLRETLFSWALFDIGELLVSSIDFFDLG